MNADSSLKKAQPRDLEKQAIDATLALYDSWRAEGFQFEGEAFSGFFSVLAHSAALTATVERDMPAVALAMERALADSGLPWPYPPTKYRARAFPTDVALHLSSMLFCLRAIDHPAELPKFILQHHLVVSPGILLELWKWVRSFNPYREKNFPQYKRAAKILLQARFGPQFETHHRFSAYRNNDAWKDWKPGKVRSAMWDHIGQSLETLAKRSFKTRAH